VWSEGTRVQVAGYGVRVKDSEFRVQGPRRLPLPCHRRLRRLLPAPPSTPRRRAVGGAGDAGAEAWLRR
jgi:hypothetical protein